MLEEPSLLVIQRALVLIKSSDLVREINGFTTKTLKFLRYLTLNTVQKIPLACPLE